MTANRVQQTVWEPSKRLAANVATNHRGSLRMSQDMFQRLLYGQQEPPMQGFRLESVIRGSLPQFYPRLRIE